MKNKYCAWVILSSNRAILGDRTNRVIAYESIAIGHTEATAEASNKQKMPSGGNIKMAFDKK